MNEVVSSILGPIVQKLASLAFEDIQLVWGIKDEREKLKSTLEIIQEVLVDAEQRQTKEAAVKHWLSKLKDFCYDADDVLDEFETRVLCRRARSTEHLTLKRKVCYLFSWLPNFIFQFKMAHKLKELTKRLEGINGEKDKFKLSSDVYEKTIVPHKETYSFELRSNVIGRNKENERMIELLIGSDDGGVGMMAVVPIIGMGGTGKTTLARLVYNDDRVNKHFENNKVWLFMPLEFKVEKLIRDIINSVSGEAKFDNWSLEMLQKHLRNILENKKWLFVMDDVWAMKREDWEGLRDLLGGVSEGSKIIVTSRNQAIAEIMGTVPPLNLANLSREDSLTLFEKYAFDQGQEKNHPDLRKIGEEIVNKCGGNPMAVKTLGSLLYSKNNRSDWEYVRDSEMWQLKTDILPSLRISYDLMPSHLKRCFACCSIFPKNFEIDNFELISLWISNGFIQSSRKNQEPEDIGRLYLEELITRSFFDVVWDRYPSLSLKMHDLIHELAILVAQTESSNIREWSQDISPTRYVSFPNPCGVPKGQISSSLSKLSCVRTILCWRLGSSDSEEFLLKTCISRFKSLRVLMLHGSSFDLLPSSIGRLKHLRFLSLDLNRKIKKLPESVCELCNLQVLSLGGCWNLEGLPVNIKNMINLRFLVITTKQQRFPESGIGCLTSLRSLIIQGCKNLEALFDDIQSLTSLRLLIIIYCPKLASLPEGIKNLKALEHLHINLSKSLRLPEGESNESGSMSRLQSLELEGLKELVLLPRWLEGSASTLQRITIVNCSNLSLLPEWLQNCSSLRTLEIIHCRKLSSLPDGIRLIPTLIKLQIFDCAELSKAVEKAQKEHSGEDPEDDNREED